MDATCYLSSVKGRGCYLLVATHCALFVYSASAKGVVGEGGSSGAFSTSKSDRAVWFSHLPGLIVSSIWQTLIDHLTWQWHTSFLLLAHPVHVQYFLEQFWSPLFNFCKKLPIIQKLFPNIWPRSSHRRQLQVRTSMWNGLSYNVKFKIQTMATRLYCIILSAKAQGQIQGSSSSSLGMDKKEKSCL